MPQDPFEDRDPFDETPPVEREMKSWIADFYRDKAKAKEATS